MNQRNVEALAALITEFHSREGQIEAARNVLEQHIDGPPSLIQALWLASRGVLVPSALDEEQCREAPFDSEYPGQPSGEIPGFVRSALERIAKGET